MYKESVILVAAVLAAASAFHTFVKPGEELVYNYTAVIKLGAVHPHHFASKFALHGKLHMQTDSNASLVSLSDLTYTLMSGKDEGDEHHGEHPVPIEQKMADLTKPFRVVYDTTGKVMGISAHSSENEYVEGMKKAIAAVIQLDISRIQLDLHGKQHAFTTEEQSVQGKVKVFYNVVPKGDKLVVTKLLDTEKHHHQVITNTRRAICDEKVDYPYSQFNKRHYVIQQGNSANKVVQEVNAWGGISLHLFKGKEGYYLHTHQKLQLLEAKPVQQHFEVVTDHFEHTIVHDVHSEGYSKGLKESIDQQHIKPEAIRMLTEAASYLHQDHIHMHTPDVMRGQLVNRIKSLLSMCDSSVLQQIHDALVKKSSASEDEVAEHQLYHEILPFVGTHEALKHIKQLVVLKKVKESTAVHMLQNMPLHVKAPTQEVVHDMEDLINLDGSFSTGVRKTALLSFSILVNKAYRLEKFVLHHEGHEHSDDDTSMYDKYVHNFVSKLRATNDFSKQKLYLEALYNMRLKSIYTYLEPAIQGKWWDTDDFRLRSLWAVFPLIQHDPHKVFSWYWPVLANKSKLTEHRVEAFYAIMHVQPDTVHLTDIFWLMTMETDKELYHVFHSYVHAMMHTTDPCKQHFREHVTEVFNSLPKLDKRSISGYYYSDFYDAEHGFGGGLGAMVLSTNTTKLVHGSITSDMFNPRSYKRGYWIKVVGLETGIADKFLLNTQSTSKVFNWHDVLHVITSIPNNNRIHIEGSVTKDSYVIDGFFYDGSNVKDLASVFDLFNADRYSYIKKAVEVDYDPETRVLLTTDVGIPAVIDFMVPVVTKHNVNVTKQSSDKIVNLFLDVQWRMWSHGTYGVRLFNPIANVKQQVMKYMMFDAVLPLLLDVSANVQQQKMKVRWSVPTDQKDFIGFRSHTTPAVVTMHYAGEHILQRSSPKDEDVVHVTHGDEYRHNYTIISKDDVNTGYQYLGAIYDADPENYATNGSFWARMKKIILATPETHSTPVGFIINAIRNIHANVFLQPSTTGMKGIMLRISPSTETPITHLELSLRLNQEVQRGEKLFTPKVSLNTRATYSVKNHDRTRRTWDMNTNAELNSGHTNNNFKVQVTRIVPGLKDYKVCVDGTVKYTVENVTGHVSVATSQSTEQTCSSAETMMDVTMVGHKNEEQHKDHVVYGVCSYPQNKHLWSDYVLSCIAAHTTLRGYEYDVKTMNVPSEFKKTALHWFDHLKGMYMAHVTHIPEHHEDVAENNLRVKIEYPVVGQQMNVEVVTHQQAWKLESLPVDGLPVIGKPESTHFSDLLVFMHSVGLMDVCMIEKDMVHHHHQSVKQHVMDDDWELYWGDKIQNPYVGVYVKGVSGKMALKLVHKTHMLEIHPEMDHHKIVLNGQDVSEHSHLLEEWMYYVVKHKAGEEDTKGPVYVIVPDTGLLVKYDTHFIKIEVPKFEAHFKGHCAVQV